VQSDPRSHSGPFDLIAEGRCRFRLTRTGTMRVPGVVFASTALLGTIGEEQSLTQVANVASLPGIVEASYAMPDMHWGYGFPIGGVAATDVDAGGVVSPGGVGFDISCGVRLLVSPLSMAEVAPVLDELMDELAHTIPRGLGKGAVWPLKDGELDLVLRGGAEYAVARGHGTHADLSHCEDGGVLTQASTDEVSKRAIERGLQQVGSLGSGNHFLEVQVVDELLDAAVAGAFDLAEGQVVVMIHSGSRGLGHQVCSDHVRAMQPAMTGYGITVPDPQLACVPVASPEGQAYLGAMAAAANYGRANRQLLTEACRDGFQRVLGTRGLDLLYDVSHNLAKLETHIVDGEPRRLCVHRKGATRALPPGHPELPDALRSWGQPVLIPGSMGTASYVLVGDDPGGAFHSAAHGAGRTMSRHAAARRVSARGLEGELAAQGIAVRAASRRGLVEEAPLAYKDVEEVARVCEEAGLARRVARLRPIGVVKG
jgi:tRNA-splicing ligase RtcB (3'-phosphate/5'-hydroxy nucleic acid ligase)